MNEIAIKVEGLGKRYRLGAASAEYKTFRDALAQLTRLPDRTVRTFIHRTRKVEKGNPYFWALQDVSLNIPAGEVIGLIGRNGAGKSTLLKILSRITEPTSGSATIRGRVGSLLEVGTGFHQELTGRENIYLNGAILGMYQQEIRRHFDAIVSFAEVEKFIDTPVKHYSSGMYLRLAFAVAAHLETDILLVDEVLAVGDAAFQKKCLGKMDEVAQTGKTVILVSHNMGSVAGLATKGVLLDGGRVVAYDAIQPVIDLYLNDILSGSGISGRVRPADVYYEAAQIVGSASIDSGERLTFEAHIRSNLDISEQFALHWFVKNEYGTPLVIGHDYVQHGRTHLIRPGLNRFQFVVGPLPLTEGEYRISLEIAKPLIKALDRAEDALEFTVRSCRLASEGHSIKTSWGNGSIIVPFEIFAEDLAPTPDFAQAVARSTESARL